jgi:hypothetical protein
MTTGPNGRTGTPLVLCIIAFGASVPVLYLILMNPAASTRMAFMWMRSWPLLVMASLVGLMCAVVGGIRTPNRYWLLAFLSSLLGLLVLAVTIPDV